MPSPPKQPSNTSINESFNDTPTKYELKARKDFRGNSTLGLHLEMDSEWEFSAKFFEWVHPSGIYDLLYWVYVFSGCWTCPYTERWKITLYRTYQLFLAVIYGCALVLFMTDATVVKDDLEKLSFNTSSSFLMLITIVKVFLLYKENHRLDDVYGKLNVNLQIKSIGESTEERSILRRKAKILSTITMGFYTLLFLGLPLRVIADTTLDPKAYLIPLPYRELFEPYYAYVYALQTIIILHFLVVVLSHDLLVFSVLIRLVAHFEILAQNFHNLKTLYPSSNPEENDQREVTSDLLTRKRNDFEGFRQFIGKSTPHRHDTMDRIVNKEIRERRANLLLKEAIGYHQILLRETSSFSQLYSLPLLVQSCGAGLLIALVILQIFFISKRMTTLLVEQIMFTVTLLWNVFFLCSFATELNTKSRMAANALYGTPWYEMDFKNRRLVQFAMKKMVDGPKLKGGRMIVVNRVTYLKFLRISYNVIAVLRHMY